MKLKLCTNLQDLQGTINIIYFTFSFPSLHTIQFISQTDEEQAGKQSTKSNKKSIVQIHESKETQIQYRKHVTPIGAQRKEGLSWK